MVSLIDMRLPSLSIVEESSILRRRCAQHVLALFLPHRSPQYLAGVPESMPMTLVPDRICRNLFIEVRDRGLMSTDSKNYMEHNEDYYFAKRKGEKLAS